MRAKLQTLGTQIGDVFMRLQRPKSIAGALRLLVEPEQLRAIEHSCAHPGELLEAVTRECGFSAQVLLSEVAEVLGLRAQQRIHIPSQELINTVSCSLDDLRSRVFVPQMAFDARAIPFLVVSEPSLFQERDEVCNRYELRLGLHSEISRVCNELYAMHLQVGVSRGEALRVLLQRLLEDAHAHRAKEVFIGAPKESDFEFHADGRAYRGSIGTEALRLLRDWMRDVSSQEMRVLLSSGFVRLRLARAQDDPRQSYVLRWQRDEST